MTASHTATALQHRHPHTERNNWQLRNRHRQGHAEPLPPTHTSGGIPPPNTHQAALPRTDRARDTRRPSPRRCCWWPLHILPAPTGTPSLLHTLARTHTQPRADIARIPLASALAALTPAASFVGEEDRPTLDGASVKPRAQRGEGLAWHDPRQPLHLSG